MPTRPDQGRISGTMTRDHFPSTHQTWLSDRIGVDADIETVTQPLIGPDEKVNLIPSSVEVTSGADLTTMLGASGGCP